MSKTRWGVFIPNKDFPVEQNEEMEPVLRAYAQGAVNKIRSVSPPAVRSGAFRDSLKVKSQDGKVYIVSTDRKAHLLEFGTYRAPAFAPMRKGTQAAGLRFKSTPKP